MFVQLYLYVFMIGLLNDPCFVSEKMVISLQINQNSRKYWFPNSFLKALINWKVNWIFYGNNTSKSPSILRFLSYLTHV